MAISKPGIVSLLVGLVLVCGVWYFSFQTAGIWAMALTTVIGGVVLLGLFLILVGVLMILI